MMDDPAKKIHEALETLELPPLVSWAEIRARYKELSRRHHPDCGGDPQKMARINDAYETLRSYVENFRFTFSEEEIARQFPWNEYRKKFRF